MSFVTAQSQSQQVASQFLEVGALPEGPYLSHVLKLLKAAAPSPADPLTAAGSVLR